MIKHWKTKTINNLSEFLILNKDSIWISKINENEITIDQAIKEKKLFGKTKFYKFSDLENIIFDEDNFKLILNYLPNDEGKKEKSEKIEIKESDFTDLKKQLLLIFDKTTLNDLTFFDKEKPIIFALLTTIGIGTIMFFTIGLSSKTIGLLFGMTIVEIAVLKGFSRTPRNGKILKLN